MHTRYAALFALAGLLTACSSDTDKPDGSTATGTGDGYTNTGTNGNGDTSDTAGGDSSWEPVAIGFEFTFVKRDNQQLSTWISGGSEIQPYILATIASAGYFSGSTDEYCEVIGVFNAMPGSGLDFPAPMDPAFELAAMKVVQDGETESASLVPFVAYDGYFEIRDHTECAGKLPKKSWGADAGRVLEVFDNMRIGFALGKHTDYQIGAWEESETYKEYKDSMLSMYIAINHPAARLDRSDITYHGEDWTTAFMWEYDPSINGPVVDENDYYQGVNVSTVPPGGDLPGVYVNSSAYWYHDFPLMDLNILGEGVE